MSTIVSSLSEQIFTSSGSALPQPSEAMLRGAAYTSKEGGEVISCDIFSKIQKLPDRWSGI